MNTTQTQTQTPKPLAFFDEESLNDTLPNLDGYLPEEMLQFRAEATEVINALQNLKSYAEAREMAGEARMKGNILLASKFEEVMETIYARLPEWAKW